jgi:hypothetical protein
MVSSTRLRADVRIAKMILTGNQIKQAVRDGDITISSFSDDFVESNSYGFHLGKELAVYTETPIDAYGLRPVDCIQIPDGGYVLRPNFFYLGHTLEQMGSRIYAAELYARLSTSLCGMFIQTSAPLGHTGALTRFGARKASEIVILTSRTLHFSRGRFASEAEAERWTVHSDLNRLPTAGRLWCAHVAHHVSVGCHRPITAASHRAGCAGS